MEREALVYFNYNLGEWLREDAHVKATAIAHYIEHNTREAYAWEKTKAAHGDTEKPTAPQLPGWHNPKFSDVRQGGGAPKQ